MNLFRGARRNEMLNDKDAAKFLGISPGRLRQLVMERKLAAVPLSERFTAYPLAELERLKKARVEGQATTGVAALLDAPPKPLPRTRNLVLYIPSRRVFLDDREDPLPVHVRIWQGPDAVDQLRTVVLLCAADGRSTSLDADTRWGEIAQEVADRLLTGEDGDSAVWFTLIMPAKHGPTTFKVDNVVSYIGVESRRHMLIKSSMPRESHFQGPTWRRSDTAELRRLTGSDPVEIFPVPASTPAAIEAWARHRRPIEVVHDTTNLGVLLSALTTLTALPLTHTHHVTAQRAATELAQEITFLEERRNDWPPHDGAVHDLVGDHDHVMAAKLIRRPFADHEQQLVKSHHGTREEWPWSPALRQQKHALAAELRTWLDMLDHYSANPQPRIETALEQALDVLRYYIDEDVRERGRDDDAALLDTYLDRAATVTCFHADGPAGYAYLDTITPIRPGTTDSSREYRQIRELIDRKARLFYDPPNETATYGRDGSGRLVATQQESSKPDDKHRVRITTLWPHGRPHLGLPDDATLEADDSVAIYIRYADGSIDLLPSDPGVYDCSTEWNHRYGGIGSLPAAITRTYALTRRVAPSRLPVFWIKDAVDYAPQRHFSLHIADISRRIVPTC